MNILVAGANGYLGGRISEYLADSGHSVSALVHHRLNNAVEWEKKMDSIIEGNAVDKDVLVSALNKGIEVVIYTISLDHNESDKDPFNTLAVNVGVLWQLLDIYSKKSSGKLIYLSTQQVYGRFKPGVTLFEDSPVAPANSYGLTHKYCEDLCSLYSWEKNMETICLRISNGFGAPVFPSCNCWWLVIMDLCKTAFNKGELRLLSDGAPQRDFIQIDDICSAISLLLHGQNKIVKHNVYNLGSGKTFTILELSHLVSQVCQDRFGKKFPIILPNGEVSKDAPKFYNKPKFKYNIDRLKEHGFKPEKDISKGIHEILTFLEQNPMNSETMKC